MEGGVHRKYQEPILMIKKPTLGALKIKKTFLLHSWSWNKKKDSLWKYLWWIFVKVPCHHPSDQASLYGWSHDLGGHFWSRLQVTLVSHAIRRVSYHKKRKTNWIWISNCKLVGLRSATYNSNWNRKAMWCFNHDLWCKTTSLKCTNLSHSKCSCNPKWFNPSPSFHSFNPKY